jgi:hypothetical protein
VVIATRLKINRAFVSHVATDAHDLAIVRSRSISPASLD